MAMKASDDFEDRLQQIWQQGHRSMAAAFLRRAMTPETTLAEVAKALQFDAVRDFLGTLKLGDVLRDVPTRGVGEPPPSQMPVPGPARLPSVARAGIERGAQARVARKRRKRRGAGEMAEIKGEVHKMLLEEPGSLDTTQMYDALTKNGHDLDRLTLNRLLAQLEEEGAVTCLGGRPKSWRRAQHEAKGAARVQGPSDDDQVDSGESDESGEGGDEA